ncbi:histone-lysine N-methyltransferase SETDB1-B-like [Pagrus major]|uniref:histone-lysine N-methyltransferase SETDB1-B-like n=1 Tax=Pagrus major TaxID=143350 RepID=UPI003CC85080
MSGPKCKSVPSTNEPPNKKVMRKAVVVLTRLPEYKVSALRPPTPQQFYSEVDSRSGSDSDMQWEPEAGSSDSDFSVSKDEWKTGKPTKSEAKRTPTAKTSQKKDKKVTEPAPVIISSAFSYVSNETTKTRPSLPEEEVKVDMMVLARRKPMRWQRGKIVEILTREDGRLKYKVNFEEKGRSLVSGHHIAYNTTPKLEQLYVGARVVVACHEQSNVFRPGIMAELPSRKNRLRFLVFQDDHVPVYVGLPAFHLVCKPLESVIDDLPDGAHKSFMNKYLKDWPYPHLTQYSAGQSLYAEFDGVQQKCQVEEVDSSLILVVFQDNQHKEWIHRGSIRLQHMARFLELKEAKERKDASE